MNKKIFKNSFINSLGYVFTVVITFFITPFVIHSLGNDLYGIWILLIGLTGYLGLLDFGMRTAIVKYVSEYYSKADYNSLNGIGSTAFSFFAFLGCCGWILSLIFSFFIENIFNLQTITQINYFFLLCIIGADIFFTFFFMIYQGSLAGFQRYDIIVKNGMIAFSLKSVLTIIVLKLGYSIVALSVIVVISNLIGFLLNYKKSRMVCSELNYRIGKVDNKYLSNLWQYSWKSFVTNISDRLIYYSDSLIIGIFLDPANITFYAIASSLVIYLRQFILSLGGVFVPAISSYDAKGDIKEIHQIVIQGTKLILFVLIPITCILIIMGEDFLRLWIGEGYEKSYQVLFIIITAQFFVLSQYGITLVLYGLGKHGILANVNIVIALLNIILSVIFVQYWGIIGVALGSAFPLIILRLFIIPKNVFRIINLKPTVFITKIIVPFFLVILFYGSVLFFLKGLLEAITWISFISIIGISMIIYCLIFYLIALNSDEKAKIKNIILPKFSNVRLGFCLHSKDGKKR
ncbi:MAG: oligosaccharide flippase family protein [Bacteroidales bacterium]|nr:oligosaccharide flippase family protein [Bacteroidales bacterium]